MSTEAGEHAVLCLKITLMTARKHYYLSAYEVVKQRRPARSKDIVVMLRYTPRLREDRKRENNLRKDKYSYFPHEMMKGSKLSKPGKNLFWVVLS